MELVRIGKVGAHVAVLFLNRYFISALSLSHVAVGEEDEMRDRNNRRSALNSSVFSEGEEDSRPSSRGLRGQGLVRGFGRPFIGSCLLSR